jgi:hypothetical protein
MRQDMLSRAVNDLEARRLVVCAAEVDHVSVHPAVDPSALDAAMDVHLGEFFSCCWEEGWLMRLIYKRELFYLERNER